MGSSIIIFLIWLFFLVVGIVAKVSKRTKAGDAKPTVLQRHPLEDILEALQKSDRPEPEETVSFAKEEPMQPELDRKPFEEGQRVTDTPPADAAVKEPEPVKPAAEDSDTEIDPVKLVVYSEIMSPGYEKY